MKLRLEELEISVKRRKKVTSVNKTMSSTFRVENPSLSDVKNKEGVIDLVTPIDVETGSLSVEIIPEDSTKVHRHLKSRHVQLIALGGAIGTGLFIGSGGALSTCGPAPLLISYLIVSGFVWTIMHQLSEMVTLIPLSGEASMYALARTYVNRPVSFMVGYNVFYAMAMIAPSEITACALVIKYWTDANSAIFVSIFLVLTCAITMLPVGVFGESEFWVASIKLITITGLIIVGIVIFFGGGPAQHHILGFHYWNDPGAFHPYLAKGNTGKFLATWTAIVKSGFSFVLIPEVLTSSSAEAECPRRNMPRVAQRYIYRLAVFYVGGVLVIGVIVAYNNTRLLNALASGTSSAAASPFVIGIQEAGIKVLPHIINASILTSAYSCGTAVLYGASRMLHSMACKGDAPKIFAKTNRFGTPYYSTAVAALFTFLAYLNCSNSSSVVFTWLSNIATISGFVSWIFVSFTYIRFRNVIDQLGLNDRIPYRKRFQKPLAYLSAGFFTVLSLTNGYPVFIKGNWNTSDFFASYVTIGFIFVLFVGSVAYHKEWHFRDVDEIGREILPKIDLADEEERNEPVINPTTWAQKFYYYIF